MRSDFSLNSTWYSIRSKKFNPVSWSGCETRNVPNRHNLCRCGVNAPRVWMRLQLALNGVRVQRVLVLLPPPRSSVLRETKQALSQAPSSAMGYTTNQPKNGALP